jgi:hypothetical protein
MRARRGLNSRHGETDPWRDTGHAAEWWMIDFGIGYVWLAKEAKSRCGLDAWERSLQ